MQSANMADIVEPFEASCVHTGCFQNPMGQDPAETGFQKRLLSMSLYS